MITAEEAARYCRIDMPLSDDDRADLDELIEYSKEYLLGAGIAATDTARYKLAQKIIVDDRYNHRGSEEVTPKAQSSLNCIILQLQNPDSSEVII